MEYFIEFKQEVQDLTEGTTLTPLWKQLQEKINKDQSESKKMPYKSSIYSIPTEKHKPVILKPVPPVNPIQIESIETKNYDMACFISSILIEGENNGYVLKII